jgi:hypothetical protein
MSLLGESGLARQKSEQQDYRDGDLQMQPLAGEVFMDHCAALPAGRWRGTASGAIQEQRLKRRNDHEQNNRFDTHTTDRSGIIGVILAAFEIGLT